MILSIVFTVANQLLWNKNKPINKGNVNNNKNSNNNCNNSHINNKDNIDNRDCKNNNNMNSTSNKNTDVPFLVVETVPTMNFVLFVKKGQRSFMTPLMYF